jgi:hypothetical protein
MMENRILTTSKNKTTTGMIWLFSMTSRPGPLPGVGCAAHFEGNRLAALFFPCFKWWAFGRL